MFVRLFVCLVAEMYVSDVCCFVTKMNDICFALLWAAHDERARVQIEITCRGQKLLPFLTLQHVRDNIWSPREAAVTLLSDSAGADHLMVLHYARSA